MWNQLHWVVFSIAKLLLHINVRTISGLIVVAELQNITDMADISVLKYLKVGVKSEGDHSVL